MRKGCVLGSADVGAKPMDGDLFQFPYENLAGDLLVDSHLCGAKTKEK